MDGTSQADLHGLTADESSRRLREEGYNELPATKSRSIFAIAFDVVREPMFLLLVACGASAFLALVLSVPVLRGLFHFAPLHTVDFTLCCAGGVVSILWFEGIKVYRRGRERAA